MREQERILKILSDRQNHRTPQPNPERGTHDEGEQQQQSNDNSEGIHT